ncbi:creatininase family protein [Massilia varians]|uniref:creatininase family protein n=1 Tax=Massilia varians TaxID=457921 RepID=UPI0024910CB7|nr:creatininase family protein [Massilia varians]
MDPFWNGTLTLPSPRKQVRWIIVCATLGAALVWPVVAAAGQLDSVHVEELTWTEVAARIAGGATTILVPVGGTEQSGPHMVLGKHNVRARALATGIARRLGNTLVAPVVAYVPEGSITPPGGHMRFAGTISIPEAAFESMLVATARSFCQHGARDIFFLGDHGGYQDNLANAAAHARSGSACRVHSLPDYYAATQTQYVAALKRRGYGEREIGTHAGLADTALSMAIDPSLVRPGLLGVAARNGSAAGVRGDPSRATAALGQLGVDTIVATSVAAIRTRLRTQANQNPSTQP